LNEKAVSSSDILSNIKETLKGLDSALDNQSGGIEITPFIEITYLSQFRHYRNIRRMGGNNLLPCNTVDLTIELFLSRD
jgi:hypothetical protein